MHIKKMTVTQKMLLHLFNASSYLKVIPVIRFQDKKVNPTWKSFHIHVNMCVSAEGSAYEESICNEDSVCGSDSTFYRQTEGADTFNYDFTDA